MELCIRSRYKVGRKIGRGAFGEIFHGTDVLTGEKVAIKFEYVKTHYPQLMYESKVYRLLKGGTGIPYVERSGIDGDYNVLVMDLLGDSLDELFKICGKKLSLKSVLMLADQMIDRIEFVHSKSYLHRDIKPANFLMGRRNHDNHKVFIIDFGLATKYRNPSSHQHIRYRENRCFLGTQRFASRNTHLGIQQSRRDDLESIGYVLIYFLRGRLPWQVKASNPEKKLEMVKNLKISTSIEDLCHGCPIEFESYFHYCRSLHFDSKPDYGYLKRMFRHLFSHEGFKMDYEFDWTILKYQQSALAAPPARALGDVAGVKERNAIGRSSVYSFISRTSRPLISTRSFPEEKSVAKVSEVALDAKFSSLKLMEQPRDWPRQASASNSRSATPVLDKLSPSSAETIKAIQKIETQQRNSPRSSKPREHLSAERIENSEPIIRSLRAIHLNNGEKCQR